LLNLFMLDLFIIVFGGGRRGGCSTTGCLFWMLIGVVLGVGLTILVNLIYLLFSSPAPGIDVQAPARVSKRLG
jgi:hypothetical protein